MKATTLFCALATTGLLTAVTPAYAGCTGSNAGTASVNDVTLAGLAADGCDIDGANPQAGAHGTISGFSDNFGSGWSLLSKVTGSSVASTTANASFGGVNYTIGFTETTTKKGSWTITVDKAVKVDLVFAVHASNNSGAFFFDDQVLPASATAGTWEIKWSNGGGNVPDFSNLTVFARNQVIATAVPEADAWAMLLAGLAGLGVVGLIARRRPA